jgi:transposase InsO family protein
VGGRKIEQWRRQHGVTAAPAPSTVTSILHRHGLITADPAAPRRWLRFEHAAANELWQLDFMGHRPLTPGQRVHALTLVDDHARVALGLCACPHERQDLVQTHLTAGLQR